MHNALSALVLAVLLLGVGVLVTPGASAATAAGGLSASGPDASVGLLTGLLAIAFLIAHQAMSDDD